MQSFAQPKQFSLFLCHHFKWHIALVMHSSHLAAMQPARVAFDFIERYNASPTREILFREIAGCGRKFGFDRVILAGLPSRNERFEQLVLLSNWPREWYERFTQRSYFPIDGVGQWAMRTSQPFTYGEVPDAFRLPKEAREVRAEAKAFGLADGFLVPIRSAGYRQAGLCFSCDSTCDLGPHERGALHLIAVYTAGCIGDAFDTVPAREKLTAREREVLAWAAEGKSAWETSTILSVSERTVTKHLQHARAKLKVATTTQAVAEALRCGEIVL